MFFGRRRNLPARDPHAAHEADSGPGPLLRKIVEITGNPQVATRAARHRWVVESGDTAAMIRLGVSLVDQGRRGEAEQFFRRAAELGSPPAMHHLSEVLKKTGKVGEAVQWRQRAAEHGHVQAMVDEGLSAVERGRVDEAERWLRGAAEQGHPEAMNHLGGILRRGDRAVEAPSAEAGEPMDDQFR